jgi:hypothetical protein
MHAPIYNMTSCPIEIVASTSKVQHSLGTPTRVLPGHNSGVLGGDEPVRYEEIIVRDTRNAERRYDENALAALRPADVPEDRWAYSDGGLSFLTQEPSTASLDQIAARPCSANVP